MKLRRLAEKRLATGALAVVTIAALAASAPGGAVAAQSGEPSLYIVQTVSAPAAQYDGGTAGFAKTKADEGGRLNTKSAAVKSWVNRLRGEHDSTLRAARLSTTKKVYDYGLTFNGYAAWLTSAEATRLKGTAGVANVWKDEIVHADTTSTRDFLGLTGNKGVWQKQFHGNARAGEGVIIGVLDSGVWPETASLAAMSEPRPDQAIIDAKWQGTCDVGVEEPIACNNKLIGARYFRASGVFTPFEFVGPRGFSGHGTHTATTAAGNFGVPVSIDGIDLGTASGVAPAARIAVYKGLWATANPDGTPSGNASGSTADLAAAIDAAVDDGVDVINYSISGTVDSINRVTDIAFFNAAAAGVFVAASAGNDGALGPSRNNHNMPWVTTVAASTHDRGSAKTVTLGNGSSVIGHGVVPAAVAVSPFVDSELIPAAGRTAADARLCLPGSLDPAVAAGKIVLCTRGVSGRTDKSLTVKNAGGLGMVLINTSPAESINGDWHNVPTVHLTAAQGTPVKAYAATVGATAAISVTLQGTATAPVMAGFSAFGPAIAGGGDLLKPDITAPGVDVIAAVAPPGHGGKNFDVQSGTSMSAPHIAGIAALLKSRNPSWSPMWIKSAMMTTASTVDNTGNPIQHPLGPASPLNYGSGHVVPGSAFDPGVVYDSGKDDWTRYACALGQPVNADVTCDVAGTIDPSNLNYPSIAVGDLAGKQTVTRTVTNVTKRVALYQVKVTAPAGFTAKASPEWLLLLPGKKASFKLTLTRTDAAFGQFSFGSLILDEFVTGRHKATSPIAVRPVPVAAPFEVTGTGDTGSASTSVISGYAGTMTGTAAGLVPSTTTDLTFTAKTQTFNTAAPAVSAAVKKITVTVPAGSVIARVATFDSDLPAGTDVDLYLYRGGTNTLLGRSGGDTSQEAITIGIAGTFDVYIVMFDHTTATIPVVKHHAWVVAPAAAGNLTISPASQAVTTGGTASFAANWSGLTPGLHYLGAIVYGDGTNAIGRTIVSVN